jgi:hypothetical protein
MKIKKTLFSAIKLLGLVMFLAAAYNCKKNNDDNTPPETTSTATDYAVASHWLSAPDAVKGVDVFYLYPTAWHKINTDDPNICDIDNPSMLEGAASAFQRQATAFDTVANIYAPYYRQADATYTLSLPEAQRDTVIGGIPTLDATVAFDYYIKHYNNGRPFILAGHSQGSNVLLFLLSGYLKDHPDVYARMITAYVIGYPITQGFMDANPHLKYAEGPDDVGVVISYNTQSTEVLPGTNPVVSDIVGLVINPISWTRDTTLATTAQGLGSLMPDQSGVFTKVPQYADARVDPVQGVLICTTAIDSTLVLGFGPGIYHSYDFPFYYFNLQENAMQRTFKFMETF